MNISLLTGTGLMTWSPVSFGLCPVDKSEDATQFFIKLAYKVNDNKEVGVIIVFVILLL